MANYLTYLVDVIPLLFKTGNLPEDFPKDSYEQMIYVHPLQLDGRIGLGTLIFFTDKEKFVPSIGHYPSDLVRRLYSKGVISSLTAQMPNGMGDALSLIILSAERLADEHGLTCDEDLESEHLRFYIHKQLDVKQYHDFVTQLHDIIENPR